MMTYSYQFPLEFLLFHCTYHSRNLLCFEMSEENVIRIELKDRKYIRIEPTVTTDEGNHLFLQNEML